MQKEKLQIITTINIDAKILANSIKQYMNRLKHYDQVELIQHLFLFFKDK